MMSKIKSKVWRVLKKNIQLSRDERQIEEEHNARKTQIDSFFSNLKNQVETEKSDRQKKEQDS